MKSHPSLLAAIIVGLTLSLTSVVHAATTATATTFVQSIIQFIDSAVVPTVFAVAFVLFVYGIYRYFILGATNEEKRKEGQEFLIWSLIGLVLMFSVWGIIRVLSSTLGFGSQTRPDYVQLETTSSSGTKSTGTPLPIAK